MKSGIEPKHEARLRLQLTTLNLASNPLDGNREGWGWHPLKGKLKGHRAVTVNATWRLTFAFEGEDATPVDYQDYHAGEIIMATMNSPASPGELLREFLAERPISQLAEQTGVARATISRVLNPHTAVSVDQGIRLGKALSLSPEFFSKAQLQFDMSIESQKKQENLKPLAA